MQFFEKRRRKAWFSKTEEEVCWEQWILDVTLATPRTDSGAFVLGRGGGEFDFLVVGLGMGRISVNSLMLVCVERAKVRRAMEMMLQKTAIKIVTTANRDVDHIPPITTSGSNPFPYQIVINPRDEGWRMGIF